MSRPYPSQYTTISECSTVYRVKSGLMIFDRYANLKYKYGRRNFWERGYFVDTVGQNGEMIKEYISMLNINMEEETFGKEDIL